MNNEGRVVLKNGRTRVLVKLESLGQGLVIEFQADHLAVI
jgi:hypothetical protein